MIGQHDGTPVTPTARQAAHTLPPAEAAARAWSQRGAHRVWHEHCMREVRRLMPLLSDALDRLAEERGLPR